MARNSLLCADVPLRNYATLRSQYVLLTSRLWLQEEHPAELLQSYRKKFHIISVILKGVFIMKYAGRQASVTQGGQ